MKLLHIIGVDEVGRGPLAGPVMVGAALVSGNFDWKKLPGVTDSKKLTPVKREVIYKQAVKLRSLGEIDFAVSAVSAKVIDKIGIVPAIKQALQKSLKKLEDRHKSDKSWYKQVKVKLDGGLKAPAEYLHQQTIIKGDAKERVIGLASIVAKVTRDNYMRRLGSKEAYTYYEFATHKGYGTAQHLIKLKKQGLSEEHRRTFCKRFH